jgi:hypothetical protein
MMRDVVQEAPGRQRRPMTRVEARGFAMVSVLLVILIFFIITIAISTIIVIQARNNFETELSALAFCQADEGVRRATPRVLYRCLMRNLYGMGRECFQRESNLMEYTSYTAYKSSVRVDIYDLVTITNLEGYTYWNRIACNARIYNSGDLSLVAQRDIYADIYMMEVPGTNMAGPPGTTDTQAWIRSSVKGYFEKNR